MPLCQNLVRYCAGFSDACIANSSTRSGGKRRRSAKARNRGHGARSGKLLLLVRLLFIAQTSLTVLSSHHGRRRRFTALPDRDARAWPPNARAFHVLKQGAAAETVGMSCDNLNIRCEHFTDISM